MSGTNQLKWDAWGTMWQPLLGTVAAVHVPGNHECAWTRVPTLPHVFLFYFFLTFVFVLPADETSGVPATLSGTDGPTTYGVASPSGTPFNSYSTRFPHGATPFSLLGDVWTSLYYSQNLGPIHWLGLNNYIPYGEG